MPTSRPISPIATTTMTTANGTGTSSRTAEAIAARSAPMLNTLATHTSATANHNTGRGNRRAIEVARPCPVVRPSRPAVSCTAAASGSVNGASHSSPNPNVAPTWE